MTFARILGITVVTSVVVFLGLSLLLPKHHEEKAQIAATTTPEQVFGATAEPPKPGEVPAVADAPSTATPPNPASLSATATPAATPAATETASAAPAAAPQAAQAGLTEEEARKIAQDVGQKVAERVVDEKTPAAAPAAAEPAAAPSAPAASSEPAAAPSAPEQAASAPASDSASASASASSSPSSSSSGGSSLSEADVRRIAAEEARRVFAEQGGTRRGSGSGHSRHAAPASDSSASSTDTAAAPDTAAEPAAAKPSKKTRSAGHSGGHTTTPGHQPPKGAEAASDAISSWWPVTKNADAGKLNLVYAGEAAYEKAVVLLFDNPMDAGKASSSLQLFDPSGQPVSGSWEASSANPRMLVFKGVTAGRYTVVIKPELTDAAGKPIAMGLHGPVYVH